MGVLDGQPVNQAVTNPAFINKNVDDVMPNQLGFSRPGSGTSIADIQATANKLYAATGASESQTGTVYNAPASTITDGESHQDALAALAEKFDPTTGHEHTGAAGDGPQISTGSLVDTALLQFIVQGTNFNASGTSTVVTSILTGKTPSSASTTAGIIVNTPYNRVLLQNAASLQFTDMMTDSSGNIIYGRITYSASVWTISFYTLVAGSETAFNFASPTSVRWFYRELFNPIISTSPVYNPIFEFWSRDVESLNSLFGAITLAATGGTTLTPSGQVLTFDSPALSSTAGADVGTAGAVGVGTTTARADHVHRGVASFAKSGSAALYGAVTVTGSGGTTATQSSQNIDFSSPALTSSSAQSVASTNSAGSGTDSARSDHTHQGVHTISTLVGDVTVSAGPGIAIAVVGQDIEIQNTGSSGGGSVTNNDSTMDVTVATGTCLFNPYLNILSGDTYEVQSGAELVSVTSLIVGGTLMVSGECRVL